MENYDIQGLDELVNRTILQGPYIDKSRLKNSLVTKQLLTNHAIEELMFT